MRASEELDEETARQVIFDIELAYNSFNRHLRET